ncbi:hypothetical protein niasHT_005124 [Heterodera trifolii]|uniref:Uncharacterized protein n=1 Tax=Heterodera trifolii TaxID=157864 RepID=A0ABD2M4E5_9BILA
MRVRHLFMDKLEEADLFNEQNVARICIHELAGVEANPTTRSARRQVKLILDEAEELAETLAIKVYKEKTMDFDAVKKVLDTLCQRLNGWEVIRAVRNGAVHQCRRMKKCF